MQDGNAANMARCDPVSARQSGVSCVEFYRLQRLVAHQTRDLRAGLRKLGAAISRPGRLTADDTRTAARFEKYMGRNSAKSYNRIAFANNVLFHA